MEYGTGVAERKIRSYEVRIDGRDATLSAEADKQDDSGQSIIYTNPVDLIKNRATPSFSLVRFGKVKNFIDGVYASVEERIAQTGHRLSRDDFLEKLEKMVFGDIKNSLRKNPWKKRIKKRH